MDDVERLRRSVVENPGEDTPRLMFADALLERGGPGDSEHAQYVRDAIALHNFGPSHLKVSTTPTVLPHGRYLIDIDQDEESDFPVGRRVDVSWHSKSIDRRIAKPGLRVDAVHPGDPASGTKTVVLVEDEHSRYYPYRDAEVLKATTSKYFRGYTREFLPNPITRLLAVDLSRPYQFPLRYTAFVVEISSASFPVGLSDVMWWNVQWRYLPVSPTDPLPPAPGTGTLRIHFERGFARKMTCLPLVFAALAAPVLHDEPVTHVEFQGDFDVVCHQVFSLIDSPAKYLGRRHSPELLLELVQIAWPKIRTVACTNT